MSKIDYDTILKKELSRDDYLNYLRFSKKEAEDTQRTKVRLRLFWDYRYRTGSYKAIKAGISQPSVMMRYKNDRFRLYGDASSNILFNQCKSILAGWKAREKADRKLLMPEYRAWLKSNRCKAKNNPYWYWLHSIKETSKPGQTA